MEKLKEKETARYNRMITWAKKQPENDSANKLVMLRAIKEYWRGRFCSYCKKYHKKTTCAFECPLRREYHYGSGQCCNGLWVIMNRSKTWGEWVINAENVKEYIKKNG